MKKIVKIASALLVMFPILTFAQTSVPTFDTNNYVSGAFTKISTWASTAVVILVTAAVIWFIWSVITYTLTSDEEKKGKAKGNMIWGVVAIAVIVSIWGIVALLQNVSGVGNKGITDVIPTNYVPGLVPEE